MEVTQQDFCRACLRHGTIKGTGFLSVRNICDHPNIDPTVQVHNFETLLDTLAKLGKNIKHRQTMRIEQVPQLHLHFYAFANFSIQIASCVSGAM